MRNENDDNNGNGAANPDLDGMRRKLENIRSDIETHQGKWPTVEDIAKRYDIPVRTLRNKFRKKYDTGLQEFITKTKQDRIRELLRAKAEYGGYWAVADEMGYATDSGLGTFIKNQTGMTTMGYHRNLRKDGEGAAEGEK